MSVRILSLAAVLWAGCACFQVCAVTDDDLASQLSRMDTRVVTPAEATDGPGMLHRDMRRRLQEANQAESQAWQQVRSLTDWQQFRDRRLAALDRSLGYPPEGKNDSLTTGTIAGEGFQVEKLVISGQPGLPITANLYLPDPPRPTMPAILICTSHHNPKHQGELQDMGMTWARNGCMVLVPDNLGHGERRQQSFGGREDYHWRYNLGIQLHLVGQSLMGWMVADLGRCLDVLVGRSGVDPQRVILIGSVAGGGDQAAVLAALDKRVSCVIPFNFGGGISEPSQASDQEANYNWASFGDFDSTRCLRLGAAQGFMPWMIVAAAAPRYLVFAREFAFDAEGDPAYQRIRKVYELNDAADHVAEIHGWGNVSLRPPEASHCNNVGPAHRERLYPVLAKWLSIPVPQEYKNRLKPEQLDCMTPAASRKFQVEKVHEAVADLVGAKLEKRRVALDLCDTSGQRRILRDYWAGLLGRIEPKAPPTVTRTASTELAGVRVEKTLLEVEPGTQVPVILLMPKSSGEPAKVPVVILFGQQGKDQMLAARSGAVADLLRQGSAVCLPDLRGIGETSPGPDRGFNSAITDISAQELKLGQTLIGSRLRDLRAVIRYIASRQDLDASRLALWGDSLAPANPESFDDTPLKTEKPPHQAEPLGGLVALLGALYEDGVKAVYVRGGLLGYEAVLQSPALYLPQDAIVPGALTAGDLVDLAGSLEPLPLRMEALVDGRNRIAGQEHLEAAFARARFAYAHGPDHLRLSSSPGDDVPQWLALALAGRVADSAVQAPASQTAEGSLDVYTSPQERLAARQMLEVYIHDGQQEAMARRTAELAAFKTPEDWRARQQRTRERLAEFFGPWPDRTPLNPKVVGRIEHTDYVIEKVIFESRPGYYVTANLYVPRNRQMPRPGVLFTCGHSEQGKAARAYHMCCLGMVLKGYVVLAFDPMGQGERTEYKDVPGGPPREGGVEEHHYIGRPSFLLGRTLAGLRTWDAIRAVDYLVSRPEVDAERLAAVGQSGGGQMVTLVTAVDERIKACVAVHPGGSCEQTFLTGRFLTDWEISSLIAPRPCRFVCGWDSAEDWIHRARMEDMLRFYRGLRAGNDRCDIVEVKGIHDMQKPKRLPVYEWLNRWFGNEAEGTAEPELTPDSPKTLQCTKSGNVLREFGGESSWSLNVACLEQIAPQRTMAKDAEALKHDLAALREAVSRRLGWQGLPGSVPNAQDRGTARGGGLTARKFLLESEPGIVLPAALIQPEKVLPAAPFVVHVADTGKPSSLTSGGLAIELARKGFVVLSVDVRGYGQTDPSSDGRTPPVRVVSDLQWDHRDTPAVNAACRGRTMAGMRAYDVLRAVDWVRGQREWRAAPIVLVGEGIGGFYAQIAAALDSRPAAVASVGGLYACRDLVARRFYELRDYFWLPGMLQDFDIADLAALCSPRPVLRLDPVDATGGPADEQAALGADGFAKGVHTAIGTPQALQYRRTASGQGQERAEVLGAFLQAFPGISGQASESNTSAN